MTLPDSAAVSEHEGDVQPQFARPGFDRIRPSVDTVEWGGVARDSLADDLEIGPAIHRPASRARLLQPSASACNRQLRAARATRNLLAAEALRSETFWLDAAVPMESVLPLILTHIAQSFPKR